MNKEVTTNVQTLTEQLLRMHDVEQQQHCILNIIQGRNTDEERDVAVERRVMAFFDSQAMQAQMQAQAQVQAQTQTQAWVESQATTSYLYVPMGQMLLVQDNSFVNMPSNFGRFQNVPMMYLARKWPAPTLQTQCVTMTSVTMAQMTEISVPGIQRPSCYQPGTG